MPNSSMAVCVQATGQSPPASRYCHSDLWAIARTRTRDGAEACTRGRGSPLSKYLARGSALLHIAIWNRQPEDPCEMSLPTGLCVTA
jgi:hypothetical protein